MQIGQELTVFFDKRGVASKQKLHDDCLSEISQEAFLEWDRRAFWTIQLWDYVIQWFLYEE